MTAELIRKIRAGDALSDVELENAYRFFEHLVNDLFLLGPQFHLAWVECNRTMIQLDQFRTVRRRNGYRP